MPGPQPDVNRLLALQLEESPFFAMISRVSDSQIVYVNATARQDLAREYGIEDPIGRTVIEVGYFDSAEARLKFIERSRAPGGHLTRDDFTLDGQQRAELIHSIVVALDGVEYCVTQMIDISQVLDAENALSDARERLEKAQSLAHIGDFVSNLDSEEFNGSAEAMRILGFPGHAHSVSIDALLRHLHAEEKDKVQTALQGKLLDSAFSIQARLDPDLAGERWVDLQGNLEAHQDGSRFVRGTIQDVTIRKREEREAREFQAKMQEVQKYESLGVLAGGIAHDFNNLLAGIMGNADLVMIDEATSPATHSRLENILTATRRASELTHQLLAYSGKGRFKIEPVDLSAIIREMSDLLAVSISRSNSLRLSLADDLPAIEVDSTEIRQVIMNLIINAAEAIEQGNGVISIETGALHCDENYLQANDLSSEIPPGQYVFFEVSDDGVGMDKHTLQRIFDPFYSTKFTGRGLGLASALGIVRGHGGAIRIQSQPHRGTTFKVLLPASKLTVVPREETTRENWYGSGVVLVIDDEQPILDYLKSVLSNYGYEVLLAQDGNEGLAAFRANSERIGLVLLDLIMPGMDGQATYAELKAIRADIPVILMSGYNEKAAMQGMVGNGFAGFLPKPFQTVDLMTLIHDQIVVTDRSRKQTS